MLVQQRHDRHGIGEIRRANIDCIAVVSDNTSLTGEFELPVQIRDKLGDRTPDGREIFPGAIKAGEACLEHVLRQMSLSQSPCRAYLIRSGAVIIWHCSRPRIGSKTSECDSPSEPEVFGTCTKTISGVASKSAMDCEQALIFPRLLPCSSQRAIKISAVTWRRGSKIV